MNAMKIKLNLIICLFLFIHYNAKCTEKFSHSTKPKLQYNTEINSFGLIELSSSDIPKLNFMKSDKVIENTISIKMSKEDFSKLPKTKNLEKDYLSDCEIEINNMPANHKKISLRGRSSMSFKRKSFSIKLESKVVLYKDRISREFKDFNLISLSMDKNYFRNRIAFELMQKLGLFNLFYAYTEVIVNEKTQGIYLILEKPKNFAFENEETNYMIRRNYGNSIKKTYYNEQNAERTQEKFEETFLRIYNDIMLLRGKEFYTELTKVLEIEDYFKWMAFNYLIGNGDYTDEVFFYSKVDGYKVKFGIIPWDYDDIFLSSPHEGNMMRQINIGDKLAFSSEDALDYKLINDSYTYQKYLDMLSMVLEALNPDILKEVFENTYQELYPYYNKKSILKISKSDKYSKTNLKNLQSDLQHIFELLIQRRSEMLLKVNNVLADKK